MTYRTIECPFCGGASWMSITKGENGTKRYSVYCGNCKAMTAMCETEAEARELWNKRVENANDRD
jgi:Lar family restriction alleviation protein